MPVIDTNKDLAALFVQQAQATPDAIALEDDKRTLSYAELDGETWALGELLRHHGVGREHLVGVLMGRSADHVIACLAALRAGGAFLVLEMAYPPGLLRDVIDDAKPTVIITQSALAGNIRGNKVPVLVIDEPLPPPPPGSALEELKQPLPDDEDVERLAFVSYSSGTTGQPKGIANPHRAALVSYDARFRLRDLGPGDRVACNVFFVWEMLRPLLRGATAVAVPDAASYDPVALVDLLAERRITDTLMTPTLLSTVLARHPAAGALAKKLPSLRSLWLNGEVVPTKLAARAVALLPQLAIFNVYSASETHEVAAGDVRGCLGSESGGGSGPADADAGGVCPVGPPLDPEHTYILDEAGNRMGVGEVGELYVGGDMLARGYLNLPETTARAFQMDPFDARPGARMYRTGDLARLLPSGRLEVRGRVGGMIKTRGYTVQPAAVEATVMRHLAVRDCVLVARGEGLERQLVAYVVPDEREAVRNRTVVVVDESGYSPVARRALSEHLAHYMIPSLWVELQKLPVHSISGKTDHRALPPPPSPKTPAVTQAREHDTNVTVDAIVKMWAASLNISAAAISPKHSFFDLGGHSLTLADLAGRLTRAFGFPVPLAPLAGTPTLDGHLDAVRAARDGHTAAVQADLPAVLRADCALPDDIRPASGAAPMRRLDEAGTVLLTGTTGYLGAFLLKTILESTTAHVLCLVRFTEPSGDARPAGMARIRKNLVDLGIWDDGMLDRMEVVPGNLARNRLGLSPEAFDELAARVDVVVHAAAAVNLVYPYAALRGANVGGTREVLRLAARGAATVHHVSTNGVLPPSATGWTEEAMLELEAVPHKLADGYGQTKWVAETLVHEAGRRGIPVRIYRPGTISGHSVTGSTNIYDLLSAIIVESLHLGFAPKIDGWLAEMTPVDFVSRAIVALASHPDPGRRLYHVGDPEPVTADAVFDSLAALGYPTEKLPWDEWVALWTERRGPRGGGDDPFTVDILRGGMPTVDTLRCVTVLNDAATRPALEQCGLRRPKIDAALWETYARHFYARGWLPRPPRRLARASGVPSAAVKRGRLAGKVAVVTGASSGMGAAVAAQLAAQGAHVVLAARRRDALEAVRADILRSRPAGTVVTRPTDVTSRDQVEALMQTTAQTLGNIDVLVVCAGVMYFTLMANAQADEWERTVDVNCKGLLHCLASTVPGFVRRRRGHIVAISSDAGRKVFPGLGVYSASKFFVEATLQALRLETASSGLRVTSVQPGNVDTDLLALSTDPEALKRYGEPTGAKVLDPHDVASAVIFALLQPEHVGVNEVLIEPREEPA